MPNPIKTKLITLVVGLASLGLGVLFASSLDWTPATLAIQSSGVSTAPTTQASLQATSNAFTRIAQEVTPSVVFVTGQRRMTAGQPQLEGTPFEEFFEFHAPNGRGPQYRESGGSGVIVRDDGFILTNNHVIDGLEGIQVVLHDRRQFDATVVGRDPSTDLAVLKIDAGDLTPARLTTIDEVQVGEWVLAFGNPFGLDFTMTAGIVSAIGRGNLQIIGGRENQYAIENFIQTDAAINPGNSGGPLVNIEGEVIGINTAIASRTGAYQGYGFAIPVSIAREVMGQLIDRGEVRRAVLGVQIQAVTALDAEALGLDRITGVRIDGFTEVPGNPARRAGLQVNDVVLAVEDRPTRTVSELPQAIAFHEPGDEVELTVWRGGRERGIDVRLSERPNVVAEPALVGGAPSPESGSSEAALGMQVRGLSPDVRRTMAARARIDQAEIPAGVMVVEVDPLGPARDAGLAPNLVITRIGDSPVRNLAEYRAAVDALEPGEVVYLQVWAPGGGQQHRAIRAPR
ncbi:MAG TPA: trypsin-like peptidase domain-containing protein [Gemmatimonadota bacterium]|nr:trypsin-like peptidase domain-containing protein [Gemmatimonadota bacterium]